MATMGGGKTRTVPMQVLALGMSRSGTDSMSRALEQLGYNRCYHGARCLPTSDDGYIWAEITERKYGKILQPIPAEQFDRILGDCMAVTDMPCAAFWPELMDAYPDAKILLVERDIEDWYRSFDHVVLQNVFSWRTSILRFAIQVGLLPQNPNMFNNRLFLSYFQARTVAEMARNAKGVYRRHYDEIEKRAKAEGREVLRMRLEEGWGPVCEFLNKPIPPGCEDGKLPRGNEGWKTAATTRVHQNMALRFLGLALAKMVLKAGVLAALLAWGVMWYRGKYQGET